MRYQEKEKRGTHLSFESFANRRRPASEVGRTFRRMFSTLPAINEAAQHTKNREFTSKDIHIMFASTSV